MKHIGSTVEETVSAFSTNLGVRLSRKDAIGRIVISVGLLVVGSLCLFFGKDGEIQKMGSTVIGLVAGYWLK
jgi:hypothetical protein